MKSLLSLLILLTIATFALAAEPKRPNFVIIYTDDLGYGDVSTYHDSDVATPNIDKLAAEGMTFTQMRANCTVCSPSRAALLTGRYADLVGVPGVIRTKPDNSWGYLKQGVPTLADELKKQGYTTACIGKWHLGLESPNTPNERGFDHFHGFLGDMMDSYITHRREGNNYMRYNDREIDPEGHATELFAQWAHQYICTRGANKEQPFFLYLAFNAPHFPIEPPKEYLDAVKKAKPQLDDKRAMNVAFVQHLDDAVAKVLKALDTFGLAENTIVYFGSDNGGSLPHAQNNDPWRDGKQSHYDGGLKVPFFVRWPGHVQPGSSTDYQGLNFDVFPTFVELAGGTPAQDLNAVSLVPLLEGKPMPKQPRDLYFVRREGGQRYGGKAYQAIIRDGWKLMQNDPYSPLELYNLNEDPQEQNNLAKTNQKKFRELQQAMQKQIQAAGGVPWQ
ncbi:N-acetylgalactosamine 6-sulfate sulfatase [Blastopirellula marina]|uniref:N-acetylgalactosamine 6-sulfate sulfatase n=1 Tax=Blastopirellula marina TaxID=124 RepID=A0A2S8FFV9_9BACT|nr:MULTISPECIES: sulfatase-like hydrolase/transferase [Pirellulaceae]PQO31055.1 N-acetylgalactosamine 6-sulfate sulfatase [Blastopirellula marina]RCS51449.1 N-acetylgalactosamine 6-sulfate sulfatase [Bremerella cremea]